MIQDPCPDQMTLCSSFQSFQAGLEECPRLCCMWKGWGNRSVCMHKEVFWIKIMIGRGDAWNSSDKWHWTKEKLLAPSSLRIAMLFQRHHHLARFHTSVKMNPCFIRRENLIRGLEFTFICFLMYDGGDHSFFPGTFPNYYLLRLCYHIERFLTQIFSLNITSWPSLKCIWNSLQRNLVFPQL